MQLRNTPDTYGAITKAFHWSMALIIIILLAMGLTMDELPMGATKLTVYTLHKSLGVTVLLLALGRILWHIVSHRPKAVASMPKRDQLAAGAMHYLLYFLMIFMPLTGWLMSSAAGRPVSFFGLFTLPDLVGIDKEASHVYKERHEMIGTVIIVCVALHAAAAVWHHVAKKDGVLKRMLPLLAGALVLLAPSASFAATQWNVLHDKSSITFRPKQLGEVFSGSFGTYSADIAFDPDDLAGSRAVIVIQTATAHTGATDRDENLKQPDWFDTVQFPEARFEATTFRKTGEGAFVADGTLTLKGTARPVSLPFTFKIAPQDTNGLKTALVDGTVTLNRADFKIGLGQWADTSIIANEVPVDIHLTALKRPAANSK